MLDITYLEEYLHTYAIPRNLTVAQMRAYEPSFILPQESALYKVWFEYTLKSVAHFVATVCVKLPLKLLAWRPFIPLLS